MYKFDPKRPRHRYRRLFLTNRQLTGLRLSGLDVASAVEALRKGEELR